MQPARAEHAGAAVPVAAPPAGGDGGAPSPPTASGDLSRSGQKKLAARLARKERRGDRKKQRQDTALSTALDLLCEALPDVSSENIPVDIGDSVKLRLCAAFGSKARYRSLPVVYGPGGDASAPGAPNKPGLASGLSAVGSVLWRPDRYDAKFLPQEYSLLHKMWALLGGDMEGAGAVDIGAGNANCAVLAAVLLGITVICVERESPREELRAEAQLPPHLRGRVVRLEADVEDFTAERLTAVAAEHGLKRVVLVAKHPCGIGVDRSIECASRIKRARSPRVAGVVMATCCSNKLSLDDNKASRVAEFCDFYADSLPTFAAEGKQGSENMRKAVDVMSRCSAWRTAAGSVGNAVKEEQLQWSELFEDSIQALRRRRLEQIFGVCAEIRFAPSRCTLQDRCLIACAPPLPAVALSDDLGPEAPDSADGGCSHAEFLRLVSTAASQLLGGSGRLDCRPRGIKSTKYGFDFTEGVPSDGGEEPASSEETPSGRPAAAQAAPLAPPGIAGA